MGILRLILGFVLFVVFAALPAVSQPDPGCPAAFISGGQCIIPVYAYYSGQNPSTKQQSIPPTSYATTLGSISYSQSTYGGSLVVTNFQPGADVTFTENLVNNAYSVRKTCTLACGTPVSGGGSGDPHFTGFDNSRFDFNVTVNGQELELGQQSCSPGLGLKVSLEEQQYPDGGYWLSPGPFDVPTATITTDKFTVKASAPPNFSRRLDITVDRNLAEIPEAEGIIGRSMANLLSGAVLDADISDVEELVDDFSWNWHSKTREERLISAYRTSGLFADDAQVTCFKGAGLTMSPNPPASNDAPLLPVSRRRLLR
ncbi:hypothetical protein WJX84_011541 [Apatococcus fuscideae]|uniref:Uncharacterized protein n=1 Tax=Apatococcus fuscideae TaxID=2026836 RepID=A0AAW1SYI1_9CHLO